MKKNLLAGLVGGLILLLWGVIAWMLLPIHRASMHNVPNEDSVIVALRSNLTTGGVYVFPSMSDEVYKKTGSEQEAAMKEWMQKYRNGPLGLIIYHPEGSEPFMFSQFLVGFVINFISAFLMAWFLSRSTAAASSYMARVAFCGTLGIFVSLLAHLSYWNWMYFPFDYTTAMIVDGVLGSLLAGLGIAAIIKPPKVEPA